MTPPHLKGAHALLAPARWLLAHYRDQGAAKSGMVMAAKDLWTLGIAALVGLVSFSDVLKKGLAAVGLYPADSILTLATVAAGFSVSFYVVTARKERLYLHGQALRQVAKLLVVGFVGLGFARAHVVADELRPLPRLYYGYLKDASNGTDIANAQIQLLTPSGARLAVNALLSDDDGFYNVRVRYPGVVRRTARMRVTVGRIECEPRYLSFRRGDQLQPDDPRWQHLRDHAGSRQVKPDQVFSHAISCETQR